ncbi:MAG: dihydrofolate reductase [Planctomycetes bacterium]|nr:dihydrofolate reductase [Planctomycetota bacterium]
MTISIIVAMTADRVIGKDGKLPWHVPEDLKFFKRMTQGHAIIMGRKTYESMGRALPRRRNVLITRQADYRPAALSVKPSDDPALDVLFAPDDESARRAPDQTCLDVVHSLDAAIELCRRRGEEKAFVIGGGKIFQDAIGRVEEMLITRIEGDYKGDTFFPQWNSAEWIDVGPADPTFQAATRYTRTIA